MYGAEKRGPSEQPRSGMISRPLIFSAILIAGVAGYVKQNARDIFRNWQSESFSMPLPPAPEPFIPGPGQKWDDEEPVDAQRAVDEAHDAKERDFSQLSPGTTLIGKTLTIDVVKDRRTGERQEIVFRIDRDARTKSLSITVDGKVYETNDTIWWLRAKVKDILSDIQVGSDRSIIITADGVGSVRMAPSDVINGLYELSQSNHSVEEIVVPVFAQPESGSIADTMLGSMASNIVTCTAHCERVIKNTQQLAKK